MSKSLSRLLLGAGLSVAIGCGTAGAATFSLTPASLVAGSTNAIVLSIDGLSNQQQVLVEEFRDANGNGVIEPGEELVLSFTVADGEMPPFVPPPGQGSPGDDDGATNGQIRKVLTLSILPECVHAVGSYLYRVSSPSGVFNSLTQAVAIVAGANPQSVEGRVLSGGVPVPSAFVALLVQSGDDAKLATAVIADAAGHFTVDAPANDYALVAFKPGYLADFGNSPQVTLSAGIHSTQDVMLLPASSSISGRVVDAWTSNGIPGLQLFVQSADGRATLVLTDTNGNFSAQVTPGNWEIETSDRTVALLGYGRKKLPVDASGGNVSGVQLALNRSRGSFELVFFFPSGGFGNGTNGTMNFPTHLQYYFGIYDIEDVNTPTNVSFTGPPGSGLSSTPSAGFGGDFEGDSAYYSSPQISVPSYPPGGLYVVNYKGQAQQFSVPNPDAENRQVILLPTAIVDALGNLAEVRWSYRNTNGNVIAAPSYLARLLIQVDGIGERLYDGESSPGQTNHAVGASVPWTNVTSIQMVYGDTLGSEYVTFWRRGEQPGGDPPPRLEIRPANPGQFGLRLLGVPGRSYSLEYSTTLTNWLTLFTTNMTGTTLDWVDTTATNQFRYYRARMNP